MQQNQNIIAKYAAIIASIHISAQIQQAQERGITATQEDIDKHTAHITTCNEKNLLGLVSYVDDKNIGELLNSLHLENKNWRKFFEEYYGVLLGKTMKDTKSALVSLLDYEPVKEAAQPKPKKSLFDNNKVLSSLIRHNNVAMPKKVFIETLKNEGYTAHIRETPKVQYDRIKFNRMNYAQQEEYERKCNEMKTIYVMAQNEQYYQITKTEYDYFHTL